MEQRKTEAIVLLWCGVCGLRLRAPSMEMDKQLEATASCRT